MAKCIHYDICGLNTDFSDGLCILHSAKPNKNKNEFAKKFEEHRKNEGDDFSFFVFPETLDFRKATFTKEANFGAATFIKGVVFVGATFNEGAIFDGAMFTERAHFRGAKFTKEASFFGATFIKWADFGGTTTFNQGANFIEATLKEGADFTGATFNGATSFVGATFNEGVIFVTATFDEGVDFERAVFNEGATFIDATFNGTASFHWAMFANEANFARATFNNEQTIFDWANFMRGASFDGAIFNGESVFFNNSHLLGRTLFLGEKGNQERPGNPIFSNVYVDFNDVDINPPNTVIFRDADLGHCSFLGTRIDQVEFTSIKWAEIRGKIGYSRKAIYDETILLDSIKRKKKSKKKDKKILDWEHIEKVYRDLKINHTASGDHERAGDFHYGEKEMRRCNPDTPCFHRVLLNLYRIISGYGERYLRPLIWAVVMLALCTFGYLLLGISEVTKPLNIADPMDWIKTSLYSLQVMTFIKSTSLEHTSLASTGLKVFQSIFGPVIIGLFALALRQRLKR